MKDKVFYVSIVGISIAIIAFGVCFGVGLCDYVGLVACCIAFVGLLYAFFQDKRHEKMAKKKNVKKKDDNSLDVKEEITEDNVATAEDKEVADNNIATAEVKEDTIE